MDDDSISVLTGDDLTVENAENGDSSSTFSSQVPKHDIKLRYNSSVINIDAFGDVPFGEIKKEIEEKTGVPVRSQELLYNGSPMKLRDDKTPYYYRISVGGFFVLKVKEDK